MKPILKKGDAKYFTFMMPGSSGMSEENNTALHLMQPLAPMPLRIMVKSVPNNTTANTE